MSKFVKTIVALFVFALVLAPMAAFAQEDGAAAAAAGSISLSTIGAALTIIGASGSSAEVYALAEGLTFISQGTA